MRIRPAVLALVLALVGAPAAAGCTGTSNPRPNPEPTSMLTRQQAADAVDALIKDAVTHLSAAATIEIFARNELPCGPGFAPSGDDYAVEHTYDVLNYDGEVRTAVDNLRTYWLGNGFRPFNETKDPDGTVTGVGVQRVSDGFHARVFYNDADDLMISASSTCVTSVSPS
jgi:hypothetical protein